jgi:hypothetical protein
VAHQDFSYWQEARPLVFGFLPIGLSYHPAFTVYAQIVTRLVTAPCACDDVEHAQHHGQALATLALTPGDMLSTFAPSASRHRNRIAQNA